MSRHVIVISEDALVYEDIEVLKTLPNFGKIWHQTARVDRVRSIYPTITYPCHVTMMTGVYPDRHGVINNEQETMCCAKGPWTHFRQAVKAPTIFDYAKVHGLTTASVFWPVTGNDPSIDYLIDEYWPQSPDESTRDCFINSGSSPEVMEKVVDPNLHLIVNRSRKHPESDIFIHACVCSIIRQFKPNLLMAHAANLDSYRHQTGVFSQRVTQGLYEIDLWFGEVLKACEDAGILEETDFFIVSDHGQMGITRTISPNVIFAENGLIDVDADGNITDWSAFAKSAAMSSHIYLRNLEDRDVYDRTYALLNWMQAQEVYGISRVFTRDEVQEKYHLSGDFSFVIETDGYTSFTGEWQRPLVRKLDASDYRFGRATHGYMPEKGPQPTLFAFGPHIRKGAVLDHARLVDEPPTIASVLGFEMPDTDGRVLNELLTQKE